MNAIANHKPIDEYLYGYVFIELFHLANKYKIFQYLIDNTSKSVEQMATDLDLNANALERILINLSAEDILLQRQDHYCINPAYAPYFDRQSDGFIGNFIHFIRNQGRSVLQQLEGHLTNQKSSQSPYDTLYQTSSDTTNFTQAMWELSYSTGKGLAQYLPADCGPIVDIGGGSGALAAALIQADRRRDITIFDLPAVQQDFNCKMREQQLSEQIGFVAGDFFVDTLPDAQTYFLSYVLSNWAEAKVINLLSRIAAKVNANQGQLIIFERLFDADGIKPFPTAVMHLNMMLHTEGSHRTEDQYRKLLLKAGFRKFNAIKTPFDKQLLIVS
ncbi:MAG: hypothetical protein ACJA13_001659 [Paraglaciecola sp.]|jgi:hypothetical protein